MNTTIRTPDIARTEQPYQTLINQIEGAAGDFYSAYDLLHSTVGLIKREKMGDPARRLVNILSADRDDALALSKHLGAIADFSDTTEQAISAVYSLIRKDEFGIDCWNVIQGVTDAVDALEERGVGCIEAHDEDTGDERIVYCAAECSLRTMFAHVTALRYRMAHQIGVVDPAGPLNADLARFRIERTKMLSTYNALLEYAPDDIGVSAHEYAKGLTALTVSIQALSILIAHGDGIAHIDSTDTLWRTYCDGAEAREAKAVILSAYALCPIDIC